MTYEFLKSQAASPSGFPTASVTVASGTSIAIGTLLSLKDLNTAAASTIKMEPCAGVAAMGKDGTDNSTTMTVWIGGDFIAKASGAIVVGMAVGSAGHSNYVQALPAATSIASGASVIGYALETAATNETFLMRLKL